MIYKYDEYKKKIVDMVGLNEKEHTKPFTGFNPKRSVGNTQLWKKFPELTNDIKTIEDMLPEYLYDFDKVKSNEILGIEPDSTESF